MGNENHADIPWKTRQQQWIKSGSNVCQANSTTLQNSGSQRDKLTITPAITVNAVWDMTESISRELRSCRSIIEKVREGKKHAAFTTLF